MKKLLAGLIAAAIFLIAGFIFGHIMCIRGNLVDIYINNKSNRTIMTATVQHERGSAIAAHIKRNRRERIRFYASGPNRYTLNITFDDNRTIRADSSRAVRSGETVTETVTDSAVTPLIRR